MPTFVCGRSVQQIPREQLVHYPIAVCANPHHLGYGKKKKRKKRRRSGQAAQRRMGKGESILNAVFIYEEEEGDDEPLE